VAPGGMHLRASPFFAIRHEIFSARLRAARAGGITAALSSGFKAADGGHHCDHGRVLPVCIALSLR